MFKKVLPLLAALTLLFSVLPIGVASADSGVIKVNNTGDADDTANEPKAACLTFYVVGTNFNSFTHVDVKFKSGGNPSWSTTVYAEDDVPVTGGKFSAGPLNGVDTGKYKVEVFDANNSSSKPDSKVIDVKCTKYDITAKKSVTGTPPANDFIFSFDCTNYQDPANVTLSKNGDSTGVSRAVAEGAECKVTETNPQNATTTTYQINTATAVTATATPYFTVSANTTVTFSNTYPVTNTVRATKSAIGDRKPAASTEYEMCLNVDTPPGGQSKCQKVVDGGTASWTGLPDGTYKVTESIPPTGAQSSTPTVSYSPTGGEVAVANGEAKTVTVTNDYGAYVTNTVQATKSAIGDREPAASTEYEMCLNVDPPAGQSKCQRVKDAGTVSWTDLPDGTYKVTESTPPAGAQNSAPTVSYSPTDGQVAVAAGETKKVTVTNDYGAYVTNTVKATKVVSGGRAPAASTEFEMCLDVADPPGGEEKCQKVKDGGTVSWAGLPDGTYTVTESTPPAGKQGFVPTPSYSPAGGQVTVDVGDTATVTVTNAYGELRANTVRAAKSATGARAPAAGTLFEMCLTPAPSSGGQCQKVAHGSEVMWTDLPDGTYAVAESTPPTGAQNSAPTVSYSPAGGQVAVDAGDDETVTVTNDYGAYVTNAVQATKVVSGARAPAATTEFEMCLDVATPPGGEARCQKVVDGGTVSWTDLPDGTYTVTESTPPAGGQGFVPTPSYSPRGGQVAVDVGDTATVTVTNDYGAFVTNTVQATKAVSGDRAPADAKFSLCIDPAPPAPSGQATCQDAAKDETVSWTGLPDGTYTVRESAPPTGVQNSTPTVSYSPADGQVSVAVGQTKIVTVTNDYGAYVTNTVSATKDVQGARAPAAGTKFKVCLDPAPPVGQDPCLELVDGETVSWTDLLDGTYSVTEETPPAGAHGFVPTPSYSPPAGQVTVAVGQAKTVTVTNNYGEFLANTVRAGKTVTGARAPAAGTLFELCLTPAPSSGDQCQELAHGGEVMWTDLSDGTYTVTESTPPAGAEGFVPTPSYSPPGGQVTVSNGGDEAVAVTNAYGAATPGSATITNTVTGDRAPSPGNFTVCLTPTVGAAQCKTLTRSGAGTVSGTWTGLAPGDWIVTQTSATNGTNGGQPTTTIITPTVTVPAGGTVTGSLTNDYGNNAVSNPPPIIPETPKPGIDLTLTAAAPNPDIGGTIVYTYLIQNIGDQTLTAVTLTDDKLGTLTLPVDSLSPGDSTSIAAADFMAAADSSTSTSTSIAAVGGSTSTTATHLITPADLDVGFLSNVATAKGTTPSGAKVNDTDDVTVDLPPRPGLTVEKSTNTLEVEPGDLVTYTYVVTNTGNVTISNISLVDDKIGQYLGGDLAGTSLGAGQSKTVTMTYTVLPDDAVLGEVTNVAVVNGTLPRDLGPISADDEVTVPVGETIVENTGFLTVSKQIDGTHEDKPYTFEVDCAGIALGRAGSFNIKPGGGDHEVGVAVPEGTECSVTETRDGGSDGTTVTVGDARAKSGREATITIKEGTNLVTFTNTFDLAPIVVPDDPSKEPKEKEPTLPATGANSMMQLLIALASLSLGATLVRRGRPAKKAWLRA